jgi:hypothetical protein
MFARSIAIWRVAMDLKVCRDRYIIPCPGDLIAEDINLFRIWVVYRYKFSDIYYTIVSIKINKSDI